MAIAFRQSDVQLFSAVTSVALNKPTGTADDDVLLAIVTHTNTTGSITPPAGWTTIFEGAPPVAWGNANFVGRIWFGWKKAASEGASWTWTFGASENGRGSVVAYSGVHGTDPFATIAFWQGLSTTYNFQAVIDAFGSGLAVAIGVSENLEASSATISGYTQRVADHVTRMAHLIADKALGAAGPVAAINSTALASNDKVAIHVVLRDASVAAPTSPTIRGWAVASNNNPNCNITMPFAKAGDLLIGYHTSEVGGDGWEIASPAGWEPLSDVVMGAGTGDVQAGFFWRVADGDETATVETWTAVGGGGATESTVFVMAIVSAETDSAPLFTLAGSTADGTTATAPGLTVPIANSLLLGFFSSGDQGAQSWTPPGGMTELYDSGATMFPSIEIATEVVAAGDTSSRAAVAAITDAWTAGLVLASVNNDPPTAPTLLTPADDGTASTGAVLSWTHNDPDGDAQSARAIRRKKLVG